MYKIGLDGSIIGVLNDWDLARTKGSKVVNTGPTGTLPFMALELLTRDGQKGTIERQYRHDAESFGWIPLYVAFQHRDDGKALEAGIRPFTKWLSGDPKTVRMCKTAYQLEIRNFQSEVNEYLLKDNLVLQKPASDSVRYYSKAIRALANFWINSVDKENPTYKRVRRASVRALVKATITNLTKPPPPTIIHGFDDDLFSQNPPEEPFYPVPVDLKHVLWSATR
jgi:hypothetical protein